MNEKSLKAEVEALKLDGTMLVGDLKVSCKQIPNEPGIYVVLGNYNEVPEFLEKGSGPEYHSNKPMNYSIKKLEDKWVDHTLIVYIGKSDNSLKHRIETYISFGKGEDVAHRGGRAIWQLPDSDNLVIGWKKISGNCNAATAEKELLKEFKQNHNKKLPFANWRE